MKKTPLQNELNLLDRCMKYLESVIPIFHQLEEDNAEAIIESIGVRVTGDLTLPKWEAACKAWQGCCTVV